MSTQSAISPVPRLRSDDERGVWNFIYPIERAISLLLLIGFSPLLLLVALVTSVLSRSSPLVAPLRAGQFGTPLWTLKFRNYVAGPKGGSACAVDRVCRGRIGAEPEKLRGSANHQRLRAILPAFFDR